MKKLTSIFILLLSLTMITGCSSDKGTYNQEYNSKNINNIEITSEVNDIEFKTSDNDSIKVSLDNCDSNISSLDNDTLKINDSNVPSGVNLKTSKTLCIYLPKKSYKSITVNSTSGAVSLSSVNSSSLKINSEYGNISVSDIDGTLSATAALGTIDTSLPIKSDIKIDPTTTKQTLQTSLGNNSNKTIILTTNSGTITIK